MDSVVENVACAGCGCVCEDVTVRIQDGAISRVNGGCPRCTEQLIGQTAGMPEQPQVGSAVEILSNSQAPLIYGLAGSAVETQRAAISLAEALGATIDLAIPQFHRAAIAAMQSVGVSTCTLGEVRQRADVVVFWGADPTNTHPSLLERFVYPNGHFVAGTRTIVSVGMHPPDYSADDYIQVEQTDNLAALAALRAAFANTDIAPSSAQLSQLAERLQMAAYSVIFFGADVDSTAEIESLFRLVRQLNKRSRCAVIGLSGTQCENVLTWQTGYPCSVNFARGYPRHDPQRYSATSLLERGEVDSVMLIGSDLSELSPAAQASIANLSVVQLGFPDPRLPFDPTVHITVGRPGVHCGGTVFRMDGVPIQLRPVFDSPLPATEAVLAAIQQGACALCV